MKRKSIFIIALVACALLLMWRALLQLGTEKEYVEAPTDKVGMILNGSAQDRGFTQALHEAASAVCEKRQLAFVSRDGVQAGDSFRSLARQLIREGCTLILCDSEAYDGDLVALARENPRVCFLNAMGTVKAHNLASCMRRTLYDTGSASVFRDSSMGETMLYTAVIGDTGYRVVGYVPKAVVMEGVRQIGQMPGRGHERASVQAGGPGRAV